MEFNEVIVLLGTLGFGGILGAVVQNYLEVNRSSRKQIDELKLKRFQCIIMLMLAKFDPLNSLQKVLAIRSDLRNLLEVEEELKVEFLNAVFYANDETISSFSKFINDPSEDNLLLSIASMRKDLWGKKTKVTCDEIKFIF